MMQSTPPPQNNDNDNDFVINELDEEGLISVAIVDRDTIQRQEQVIGAITIFENERTWVGGGFSKGGLLPNDRGRFCTQDGSRSFKTLDDASEALCLPGYAFVSQNDDDDSDWNYARDFTAGAIASAQPNKGPLHFVRFRRHQRAFYMEPKTLFLLSAEGEAAAAAQENSTTSLSEEQALHKQQLLNSLGKCIHVDSEAVRVVSRRLRNVLAYLMFLYNPSNITDAVALTAKRQVLECIRDYYHKEIRTNHQQEEAPATRIEMFLRYLQKVADDERQKAKYILSRVEFFSTCIKKEHAENNPDFTNRIQAVEDVYWPARRDRHTIAAWMVRLLDEPEYEFHCSQTAEECQTSSRCPFAIVNCPNPSCPLVLSQKHLAQHDAACPYKMIVCACGASLARQQKQHHDQKECPLRTSTCPFASLGCSTQCQAQHLPLHIEQEVSQHLLLSLHRIEEMQDVMRDMNGRLVKLQEEKDALEQLVQQQQQSWSKDTKTRDQTVKTLTGKVKTIENTNRKEFKRIRDKSRERARKTEYIS
mmetsp:Transcript_2602/g.5426  ORF Transcript_2602/g.5426 Transcript_2602/m.5426 type:complete len:533 (+) Transcript_2602:98-1696(+)